MNGNHGYGHDINHRVLIVDDDEFLRGTLGSQLEQEGFKVRGVGDGQAMFQALTRFEPDLVLMDVRLPGDDGLTLMRQLREQRAIPVVLLTSKCEVTDKVIGLELGADDYVTKPFVTRELIARINARLRQHAPTGGGGLGRRAFDGWTLDLDSHELSSDAAGTAPLTTHEFKALATFVNHSGRVLSREQLMDAIVGREWLPNDRTIDVLVARLRRRLHDPIRNPRLIKTIHGAGYMFAAKVTRA